MAKAISSTWLAAGLVGALLPHKTASAATIAASEHQLLVDGAALTIRGINYSPTPNTGVRAAGGGDFTAAPAVCAADFAKMREMGANVVRVYVSYETLFNNFDNHDPTSDTIAAAALDRYRQVLATAQSQGMWIVMNYWVPQNVNYDLAQPRQWQKTRFQKIVHTFKDAKVYPNVLLWAFGNENNLASHLAGMTGPEMFSFYQEAIAAAKAAEDTTHPYTVVLVDNGDVANVALLALAPSVDVWPMTLYQTAAGYERTLRTYAGAKPLVFMEFGQDAYAGGESQATQAAFYGDRWGNHIAPHLSARDANQVLLGGCVFEWNDEWWKAGNPPVHDPGGSAGNDDADNQLNEEWFGLSTALPDGVAGPRNYRQAFDALQTLWTATSEPDPTPPDAGASRSGDASAGHADAGVGGAGGAGGNGNTGGAAASGGSGVSDDVGGASVGDAPNGEIPPSNAGCKCEVGRRPFPVDASGGSASIVALLALCVRRRGGRRGRVQSPGD